MPGDQLPSQIGPYRILKQLGAGGMGAVYLAEHVEKKLKVALKVPQLSGIPSSQASELVSRFRREAAATSAVQHRNVCRVYEAGSSNGQWYLAMAYVPGRPLNSLTEGGMRLEPRQAVEISMKIARGMQAVHKAGVIHRDLKPHNVILTKDNEPIVVDFGLAKNVLEASQNMTKTGAFLGTPVYAAPEQFADTKRLGPSGDIYSLGVILFELLTGRPPFQAKTLHELLQQILMTPAPRPSSLVSGLDSSIDTICRQALEKSPKTRYASMNALAGDLRRYLNGEPVRSFLETPGGARPSRRLLIGGGVSVAALLLAIILGRSTTPGTPPAPRLGQPANGTASTVGGASATDVSPASSSAEPSTPAPWTADVMGTGLATDGANVAELMDAALGTDPDVPHLRTVLQGIVAQHRQRKGPFALSQDAALMTVRRLASVSSPEAADLLRAIALDADSAKDLNLEVFDLFIREAAANALVDRRPDGPWSLEDIEIAFRFRQDEIGKLLAGRERPSEPDADADALIALLPRLIAKAHDSRETVRLWIGEFSRIQCPRADEYLDSLVHRRIKLLEYTTDYDERGFSGAALQGLLERNDKATDDRSLGQLAELARLPILENVLQASASGRLRLAMARRLPHSEGEEKALILAVIGLRHPVNLQAQAELYATGQATAEQMSALESWFWIALTRVYADIAPQASMPRLVTEYATDSLDIQSGPPISTSDPEDTGPFPYPLLIPVFSWAPNNSQGDDPRSGPPMRMSSAEMLAALNHPQLTDRLVSRLSFADVKRHSILRLLASLPDSKARQAFRMEIQQGEKVGPSAWLNAAKPPSDRPPAPGPTSPASETTDGLATEWLDPGALLALKSVGRTRPKEDHASPRFKPPTTAAEMIRRAQKSPADLKQEWYLFVRQHAQLICQRCLLVAQSSPSAGSELRSMPASLELPEDASLTTSRDWTLAVGGSPVTVVSYRRLATGSMSRRVLADLQRQMKELSTAKSGRLMTDDEWLDLVWTEGDSQSSLDVLFHNENERQIVEVLSVVVPAMEARAADAPGEQKSTR